MVRDAIYAISKKVRPKPKTCTERHLHIPVFDTIVAIGIFFDIENRVFDADIF